MFSQLPFLVLSCFLVTTRPKKLFAWRFIAFSPAWVGGIIGILSPIIGIIGIWAWGILAPTVCWPHQVIPGFKIRISGHIWCSGHFESLEDTSGIISTFFNHVSGISGLVLLYLPLSRFGEGGVQSKNPVRSWRLTVYRNGRQIGFRPSKKAAC